MAALTLDLQRINLLRDIPEIIPVVRDYYENWKIKVFNREHHTCRNYLSPNRRDFYKIIFLSKGTGIFSIGVNTYYINEPTVLFIHPNEIISWQNLAKQSAGHFTLFKKQYIEEHPALKAVMEKYNVFADAAKSVIRLPAGAVLSIDRLFMQMHEEKTNPNPLAEDALQAYIQLIIIASAKVALYPKPDLINDKFKHIHAFFQLLENETSCINYTSPIRIRTVKEFAGHLSLHPNHLNALLKKHTGQNVSTHIKNRLLEESKILLLQTNWTLQNIGYALGFAEQPNFSLFFKKNIGITPDEFRRSDHN